MIQHKQLVSARIPPPPPATARRCPSRVCTSVQQLMLMRRTTTRRTKMRVRAVLSRASSTPQSSSCSYHSSTTSIRIHVKTSDQTTRLGRVRRPLVSVIGEVIRTTIACTVRTGSVASLVCWWRCRSFHMRLFTVKRCQISTVDHVITRFHSRRHT